MSLIKLSAGKEWKCQANGKRCQHVKQTAEPIVLLFKTQG